MGFPQLFTAILVLVIGMLAGNAVGHPGIVGSTGLILPNLTVVQTILNGPTPYPEWKEQTATISAEEAATASGSFAQDFESAIASLSAVHSPTPTIPLPPWLTATSTPSAPPIGPTGATGIIPTYIPTPTQTIEPSPTLVPSATPWPTSTPTPTETPVPSPTREPTPLNSPSPITGSGDTIPPSVTINGGPAEGALVGPGSVCFPLWVVDNLSWYMSVQTRFAIDNGSWSAWKNGYEYCTNFGTSGDHVMRVQAKDEAGNVSSEVQRKITVR